MWGGHKPEWAHPVPARGSQGRAAGAASTSSPAARAVGSVPWHTPCVPSPPALGLELAYIHPSFAEFISEENF